MNTWVRRSLKAGALTAGAVMVTGAAGGSAAFADTTLASAGNHGILSGTQLFAPVQAPINLCGIAIGGGGDASAGCKGGSSAASTDGLIDTTLLSAGNHGTGVGNQIFAPVQAPINICGVAIGLLGDATAGCVGGATATTGGPVRHRPNPDPRPRPGHNHGHDHHCGCGGHDDHDDDGGYYGDDESGLLSGGGLTNGLGGGGMPVVGDLTSGDGLPVVGSLLSGLLGGGSSLTDGLDLDSLGTESATESANGGGHGHHQGNQHGQQHHNPRGSVVLKSWGNHGTGVGNQVYAPIQAPINISGVAIGLLGDAQAWSLGGASATR